MKLSEKCHLSKYMWRGSTRFLLQTLHTAYRSLRQLAFLQWIKVTWSGIGWVVVHYKVIHCILSLVALGLEKFIAYFCCHFYPCGQACKHCLLFPWAASPAFLQHSFFFNACWSQLLMNIGLGWSNRMLGKKHPVHTTPCVIEHPFQNLCKISAHPDVAFSHLTVTIDAALNGLASFVLSHSDRHVMHIVQEWDEVSLYSFCDNTHGHGITRLQHFCGCISRVLLLTTLLGSRE